MKYVALVDDDDYENLIKYYWNVNISRGTCYYACTSENGKTIRMHRFVMNAKDGQMLDHIDGNGLNNQKSNLRFCTPSQNSINRKGHGNSSYRGVRFSDRAYNQYVKKTGTIVRRSHPAWEGCLTAFGVTYRKSGFKTEIEAALWYDEMAKKYHGEFARLNFPEQTIDSSPKELTLQ